MKNIFLNRASIYLLRKKFGLKKFQPFRFENQKSEHDFYYFTNWGIKKCEFTADTVITACGIKKCEFTADTVITAKIVDSDVGFDWLINRDCRISKILPNGKD